MSIEEASKEAPRLRSYFSSTSMSVRGMCKLADDDRKVREGT